VRLDEKIQRHYDRWISDAPVSYKKDSFILERKPIIVTSQYWQNQEMLETEGDADSWERSRDFSHIHYMSVAIATHFRYLSKFIFYHPIRVHSFHQVQG
jgi:hypothetical protein